MSNPYLDALESVLDENPGIGKNQAYCMANARLPNTVKPKERKRWWEVLNRSVRGREINARFEQIAHSGQSDVGDHFGHVGRPEGATHRCRTRPNHRTGIVGQSDGRPQHLR